MHFMPVNTAQQYSISTSVRLLFCGTVVDRCCPAIHCNTSTFAVQQYKVIL